ncbi:MAG TPA: histidine phosphatase family protein [Candidatus Limnocylindria bacterium]|jgi:probable phosphoglycerate mutase|nr:histidine phosphatase family protein [Candidatus Limnocylindria bacterium]
MGSLVLVRHAITAASAAGRNLGQREDPPLSDAGMELADRLGLAIAAELSELPHDELRVITSPALRCRQTAAAIGSALGVAADALEVEPGLLEIDYGSWDGLTADEARERDPELRAAWEADPFATRCPDGESGSDVARRAFAVLEPIEAWLAADRARCAVVVAHNHVNRLRLCALFGWPMREYRARLMQDPGGYSLVGFGGEAPVVRRVNAAP